jgi:hypothetical protein
MSRNQDLVITSLKKYISHKESLKMINNTKRRALVPLAVVIKLFVARQQTYYLASSNKEFENQR